MLRSFKKVLALNAAFLYNAPNAQNKCTFFKLTAGENIYIYSSQFIQVFSLLVTPYELFMKRKPF